MAGASKAEFTVTTAAFEGGEVVFESSVTVAVIE
jgi:hypothetical protein